MIVRMTNRKPLCCKDKYLEEQICYSKKLHWRDRETVMRGLDNADAAQELLDARGFITISVR